MKEKTPLTCKDEWIKDIPIGDEQTRWELLNERIAEHNKKFPESKLKMKPSPA